MTGIGVTSEMGRIASNHIEAHLGDLIIDGMMFEHHSLCAEWIWCVRNTGTDLFPLNNKYQEDYPFHEILARNEIVFHITFFQDENGKITSTGEINPIEKETALERLRHQAVKDS